MPLDEFIINVYYQEALTLEIVGAYLGMSQDKQIWSYFHRHWRAWFPGLGALDLCAPIGQPVGAQAVHAPPLGQAAGSVQRRGSPGRWLSRAGLPLSASAFQPGVSL